MNKAVSATILTVIITLTWVMSTSQPAVVAPRDFCKEVLKVLDSTRNVCERFPASDHCNVFVGKAVQEIYNIDDFVNSSPSGFYIANQIVDRLFVELSAKWRLIGTCEKQTTLDSAQLFSNSNRCVIAAWKNPVATKPGHVCLILPGKLKQGWGDMQVPNAANFAQEAPQNNFVCDRLSGAFSKDKRTQVFIFVHEE
jgi:hypothetical protein